MDEIVRWFNEVKPHESLDFEHAETPAHAFVRKMRPKERKAYLKTIAFYLTLDGKKGDESKGKMKEAEDKKS